MKNHDIPSEAPVLQRFDEAEIEGLARLMATAGLTELRLVRGASSVHLRKADAASRAMPDAAATPASKPADPGSPPEAAAEAAAVRAPLYGIVHLTPAPDQPPFVQAGSLVSKGQTVALIEAMKTFHAVCAHRSGTVAALHVAAGQEVQAGDPLMELACDV